MFRFVCILLLLLARSLHAQSSCDEMLLLADSDLELEYTTYDNNGKACAKVKTKVILVEETKQGTIFHFESNTQPCKGTMADRQLRTYYIRCHHDTLYTSMKAMLPPGTLESYSGMQLVSDGTDLKTPKQLKENDELPAASLSVVVNSNGVKLITLKANTSARKVEKKESITTPAGTFECIKVSETTEVKVGMITNKTVTNTWYAPGMGMIKQETYDKKGKLASRTELEKKS